MMWILILFICYLPVSGALWAERDVRGVVGRAITINCHYTHWYRSHTKYWCDGWTRRCSTIVATTEQHGRRGRASITDNPAGGIFTVTVEDLHPGDAGLYSCGISTFGLDPMFPVHLQVSDEPVSVPVIGFLSPTNVSRLGGSVSVSCESVQGSLPIQYTWYEKTQSVDSKVSDTSKLDLHCQSFKHQHHQYYCTASNNGGAKSSDFVTVNVMVFNSTGSCSFVTETNNTVSGALLAKDEVRGVVGRAITIDCHYAAIYRSHTKYWCRVWDRHCSALMKTNEQRRPSGRRSITDNPGRGIFTVTVEDLRSEDTGMYKCGITTLDKDPTFNVHLQISDEPVSVPVLGFLSPANVSSPECSVSVSCESVQGSFPIDYAWYEKTPSADLKISDTNKLDLHCQSFKHRHHQYYCTASNKHGNKSSEMIKLSTSNSDDTCIIVKEVNNTGSEYSCDTSATKSMTNGHTENTEIRSNHSLRLIDIVVLSVVGVLLMVLFVCLLWYLKRKNWESERNASHRGCNSNTQEMSTLEGSVVYADLWHLRNNEAAAQLADNENGIVYTAVQFQRKSRAGYSVTDEDNVTYTNVKFQSNPARANQKAPSPDTLQDSAQAIYANSAS